MKFLIPLAISAFTWHVQASFLPFTLNLRGEDVPSRPTQTQSPGLPDIDIDNALSAFAATTTAPPSQAAVELRLRQDTPSADSTMTSNTWVDGSTCGWYSAVSSMAFVCTSPVSCATNTDHVVACTAPAQAEFHTICLDYEAVQSSKCTSAGPKTACCTDASAPACGTLQWAGTSGTPTRSMFRCYAEPTFIPMLDEPRFVLDASISSASVASASSAAASVLSAASASSALAASSASAASLASAAASRASGLGGSSVTITTSTAGGSLTTFTAVAGATGSASGVTFISSVLYTTTGSDGTSTTFTAIGQQLVGASGSNGSNGSNGGSGGTNTAAIAGGVIGGILGLLLMLLMMWYLMKKTKGPKLSLKICGGNRKKGDTINKDNREYNDKREYKDKREYDNRQTSKSGKDNGKGGGFSLRGGKSKSKTEEQTTNTTNNYYGDEVRNDNRAYDKRKFKDNRAFEDNRKYAATDSSDSPGALPPYRNSHDDSDIAIGAIVGSSRRNSSRREQRKQGRSSRTRNYSRSPSPAPVSPMSPTSEAAFGGSTSRRDKRRQERKQARGEYTPSPSPPPQRRRREEEEAEEEFYSDDDEDRHQRAAAQWQVPAQRIASSLSGTNGGGVAGSNGQPQNVHVHVHIHDSDRKQGSRSRGRSAPSQERPSRASSRRMMQHHQYDDEEDEDHEEEVLREEERRQEMERGGGGTHRYHPGSGRRNVPVGEERSASPPRLGMPPDDFIAKAL